MKRWKGTKRPSYLHQPCQFKKTTAFPDRWPFTIPRAIGFPPPELQRQQEGRLQNFLKKKTSKPKTAKIQPETLLPVVAPVNHYRVIALSSPHVISLFF